VDGIAVLSLYDLFLHSVSNAATVIRANLRLNGSGTSLNLAIMTSLSPPANGPPRLPPVEPAKYKRPSPSAETPSKKPTLLVPSWRKRSRKRHMTARSNCVRSSGTERSNYIGLLTSSLIQRLSNNQPRSPLSPWPLFTLVFAFLRRSWDSERC
jgi:hypothetical protein